MGVCAINLHLNRATGFFWKWKSVHDISFVIFSTKIDFSD